tara:strand:+ start:1065 stop:1523 length:459 start_codon:yes stop_codon:yes gene_type:complete
MKGLFKSNYIKSLDEGGDKVSLPEKDLWVSVLSRAALDVVRAPNRLERDQACAFFMKGGRHFRNVCEMAGRNPDYVQQKMRKYILREEGWNVDVPITSHYRTRVNKSYEKRGPKFKGLTGNDYYAAKAKKNFYYQGMGSKGGRPRIYNKIEK